MYTSFDHDMKFFFFLGLFYIPIPQVTYLYYRFDFIVIQKVYLQKGSLSRLILNSKNTNQIMITCRIIGSKMKMKMKISSIIFIILYEVHNSKTFCSN